MFELDYFINDLMMQLDDSRHSNEVYDALKMDIIHAQICLAHYFEWKEEQKTK